jgi:hypothetical protein
LSYKRLQHFSISEKGKLRFQEKKLHHPSSQIISIMATDFYHDPLKNRFQDFDFQNSLESTFETFRQLLSQGKISTVVQKLLETNLGEVGRNFALALSARFRRLESYKAMGTMTFEQRIASENQLVADILELLDSISRNQVPPLPHNRKEITMLLDYDINLFTDLDKISLLESILSLLRVNSYLIIKRVEKGSVKVTIEMPEADALSLLLMYKKNALKIPRLIKLILEGSGHDWQSSMMSKNRSKNPPLLLASLGLKPKSEYKSPRERAIHIFGILLILTMLGTFIAVLLIWIIYRL